MGVDLRLLPLDHLSENTNGSLWGFSHTVLSLPRNREAWSAFKSIATPLPGDHDISSYVGKRVPDGSSQGELMYGRIRENDAYGSAYTWATAGDLYPVLAKWFPGTRLPSTSLVYRKRPASSWTGTDAAHPEASADVDSPRVGAAGTRLPAILPAPLVSGRPTGPGHLPEEWPPLTTDPRTGDLP